VQINEIASKEPILLQLLVEYKLVSVSDLL